MEFSVELLRSFVERTERLIEERNERNADIKEVLNEAKIQGYEPKAIRQIVNIRSKNPEAVQEEEYILDTYKNALGIE